MLQFSVYYGKALPQYFAALISFPLHPNNAKENIPPLG